MFQIRLEKASSYDLSLLCDFLHNGFFCSTRKSKSFQWKMNLFSFRTNFMKFYHLSADVYDSQMNEKYSNECFGYEFCVFVNPWPEQKILIGISTTIQKGFSCLHVNLKLFPQHHSLTSTLCIKWKLMNNLILHTFKWFPPKFNNLEFTNLNFTLLKNISMSMWTVSARLNNSWLITIGISWIYNQILIFRKHSIRIKAWRPFNPPDGANKEKLLRNESNYVDDVIRTIILSSA